MNNKEILGRILMRKIVGFLDATDYGLAKQDYPYAPIEIGRSGADMYERFLNKLSPERRQWYLDNEDIILFKKTDDIRETEIPELKRLVKEKEKRDGTKLNKNTSKD